MNLGFGVWGPLGRKVYFHINIKVLLGVLSQGKKSEYSPPRQTPALLALTHPAIASAVKAIERARHGSALFTITSLGTRIRLLVLRPKRCDTRHAASAPAGEMRCESSPASM